MYYQWRLRLTFDYCHFFFFIILKYSVKTNGAAEAIEMATVGLQEQLNDENGDKSGKKKKEKLPMVGMLEVVGVLKCLL